MVFSKYVLSATVVLAVCAPAFGQVAVADPWVRGTVAQQKATGLFMTLTSVQGGRVVGASSPAAGVVEIHEMKMEGTTMRMRAMDALELPAGKPVELKPGGYHVMLMDLKQPLKAGDTVPVTLVIEGVDKQRTDLVVQAPVRALNAQSRSGAADPHQHHHHSPPSR